MCTSAHDKLRICFTCHNALKRKKLPSQAKANGLELHDVPLELKDMKFLEVRLISKRIPFMKLVALPRGRQHAIHGPAVNVPTTLTPVCKVLPPLQDDFPMKLKRK